MGLGTQKYRIFVYTFMSSLGFPLIGQFMRGRFFIFLHILFLTNVLVLPSGLLSSVIFVSICHDFHPEFLLTDGQLSHLVMREQGLEKQVVVTRFMTRNLSSIVGLSAVVAEYH